jgi:transcriptional regulator with XRE-family HTH domain
MAVGESPAVARHRLRLALREAREAKGLTQRQVAKSLEWSMSKVNRIESGEVTISRTDLQALLDLLKITDSDQVEVLVEEARAARRRGWWDQPEFRAHISPAMIQNLQFEAEASAIRSFQPTLIPGSLQTRAYASAIVDLLSEEYSDVDRATRIDVRVRRRDQLISRPDPPDYLLVLDESVLLREVGGSQVMSEQLYDLLGLTRTTRVTVRVAPLAHATLFAAYGLFTIYASDDEDVALYLESHVADEVVYAPKSIRRHRELFEQMWGQSLSVDASARLIEARAAAMRSAIDRQGPAG